jgi:hypothetical protein
MHRYRPQLFELEERALPNVLADPLATAGVDTLLALDASTSDVAQVVNVVSDAIDQGAFADLTGVPPPPGPTLAPTVVDPVLAGAPVPIVDASGVLLAGTPIGTPHPFYPVQQFDASKWGTSSAYGCQEIGPPYGAGAVWSTHWDQYSEAYLWTPTWTNIAYFKVSPPSGCTPAYTLGPVVTSFSNATPTTPAWSGQDVAGNWSELGVYLQIWNPGVYGVSVGFTDGSSYKGFVSVLGGNGDGNTNGQARAYYGMADASSPGAIVIAQSPVDKNNFCLTAASLLPKALRAATMAQAVQAFNLAYLQHGSQPIDAILIGHGVPNRFRFDFESLAGDNYVDPPNIPANLRTNNVEKDFAKAMQGKIHSLRFFSCNVGQGFSTDALHLCKVLSKDLQLPGGNPVLVSAYTANVGIEPGVPDLMNAFKAPRGAYFYTTPGQWVSAP